MLSFPCKTTQIVLAAVDDSKTNPKFLVRHLKQAAMQQFQISLQRQPLAVTVALEVIIEEMDDGHRGGKLDYGMCGGSPFSYGLHG